MIIEILQGSNGCVAEILLKIEKLGSRKYGVSSKSSQTPSSSHVSIASVEFYDDSMSGSFVHANFNTNANAASTCICSDQPVADTLAVPLGTQLG